MNRRNQAGMTFIEILVVLAIIGILLSVATPVYRRAIQASQESAAVTAMRTIADGENTYFQLFSSYSPDINSLGGPSVCTGVTATQSCILDTSLTVAPFTKNGYFYAANGSNQVSINDGNGNMLTLYFGFEANGSPTQGSRNYCTNETGVIRYQDGGSGPIGTSQGSCAQITTTVSQ